MASCVPGSCIVLFTDMGYLISPGIDLCRTESIVSTPKDTGNLGKQRFEAETPNCQSNDPHNELTCLCANK